MADGRLVKSGRGSRFNRFSKCICSCAFNGEQRRRRRWNKRRKPWRQAAFIRRTAGRNPRGLRFCLCCMAFAELMVIGFVQPALWTPAGSLPDFWWEKIRINESETVSSGAQEFKPSDKSESGITIDLKEGIIEFWRSEEAVGPEGSGEE